MVCTHNAGRSVAARVLLDHHGAGRIRVGSAGSAPGDEINPAVAWLLAERGLDAGREFPKPLTDEIARAADVIITMGCGDACPIYPGTNYLDWDLPDPAGLGIDEVRPIVDEIERRVLALLDELEVGVHEHPVHSSSSIGQMEAGMTDIQLCCTPLREAPLSDDEATGLARTFSALADPVRLRLLSLVAAADEVCSCDLQAVLGKAQPTISHHTKALSEAGLILGEKRGRWVWWRIVPERLEALRLVLA